MAALPPPNLLVVSVDAMHIDDLEYARTLPGFSRILAGASVAEIEGVFPSVTYTNHATQLTGCSPARHGIYNNQQFQPYRGAGAEWFWDSRSLTAPTIFAAARAAGLSTAAVQWPVTANEPDVDWLVPEIASPWLFDGFDDQYLQTTDARTLDTYIRPNLHLINPSRKGKYLGFVRHVSTEILRRERPDVMFVHLVDVDFVRHTHGANGPHVQEALRAVDATLCDYLAVLDATDDFATTNLVLVSDHGHIDVEQQTHLNALFAERGLLRTDAAGELLDFDLYCLGAGLSGQLFLADGITPEKRSEVEALLVEIEADPRYRIEKIWTAQEARTIYGLDGPFTWVVESEPGVAIGTHWNRRPVVLKEDADYRGNVGAHGHAPRHGGQPMFIATGPAFATGVQLGRRSMLDEAPTFAAVLGLALPQSEGTAMQDVLINPENHASPHNETDEEAMQKHLAYDRQLERFNPLDRVITFDDFDTGFNGWMDLTPNFVYDNYESFNSDVDLTSWAPCMLSSAPMRFAASHGSMEGTYSLKLSTRPTGAPSTQPPADGSMGVAVKRLSRFGDPDKIQIETWYSYTPAQDREGIGEADIRAFGFYFDIQDGEHRYMPGVRYVNALDGKLVKRWQYWKAREDVTHADWNYGVEDGWCAPGVDNLWYGTRYEDGTSDGYQWVPGGEQDLLYNESPDKINWLYLRLLVDVRKREYIELQSMDTVFDMRGIQPTLADRYTSIDNLINPIFYVETDTDRSVHLFLDSVVYSTE